jgi:hypothetical protein
MITINNMNTFALLVLVLTVAGVSSTLTPSSTWSLHAWGGASPEDSDTNADMVVVDMFDTDATTIDSHKAAGRMVVCYFSAGTSEDWRDDVTANIDAWNAVAMGTMAQWGGEAWLDINQLDTLKVLMTPRLDLAASKGCNAVEPDNTDCFTNPDECAISGTAAEKSAAQLAYNTWTAEYAHSKGMLCALKNTGDLAAQLATVHDFAIVEQCVQFNECSTYSPFFAQGKPIFGIEYQTLTVAQCSAAVADHVQMKHCAGSSADGLCLQNELKNCYAMPDCTQSMFATSAEAAACSSDGGAHQMGSMWMVGVTHGAGTAELQQEGETCGNGMVGFLGDCASGLACTCTGDCANPQIADIPSTCSQPNICCLALIASCLACSVGVTEATYCKWHPTTAGCTNLGNANSKKTCSALGWKVTGNICAESSDGWACKTDATYAEAETACAAAGARVCTIEEIETGATAKTGCSMDSQYVWSSTWCGLGPKYYVGMGAGTGERKCKKYKKAKSIRCCSDVLVAADAVTAPTTTTTYAPATRKNCATLGWPVVGSACGESDQAFKIKFGSDKCYNWLSQPDGEKQCARLGGRLCTQPELAAGVAKSTGCSFDSKFIWTSTTCTGGYIKAKANGETECRGVGENGPLKCCSDVTV